MVCCLPFRIAIDRVLVCGVDLSLFDVVACSGSSFAVARGCLMRKLALGVGGSHHTSIVVRGLARNMMLAQLVALQRVRVLQGRVV